MTSAPTSVDIGTLIWKSPHKGGRACLAGRNITVSRIVELWREPLTPEQVAEDAFGLDVVSVADVYAALAYYHANRLEIENEIAELIRAEEELSKDPRLLTPDRLRERQSAHRGSGASPAAGG